MYIVDQQSSPAQTHTALHHSIIEQSFYPLENTGTKLKVVVCVCTLSAGEVEAGGLQT